ncbi:hypothetical protein ACFYSC_08370 [Streptosporangium sp. NPDC004379]|uniref:hypothetical protein n=1 Tax=Streptosporangium sp. NPDC004379 TaxID=3366189 RepID=UPI0036982973
MSAWQPWREHPPGEPAADAGRPGLEEILDRAAAAAVDTFSTEDILDELDRGRSERRS